MEEEEINEQEDDDLDITKIECAAGQEPMRIDKFLMGRIEGATRNKLQQAISAERILVNNEPVKSNYKVRPKDIITIIHNYLPGSNEIVPQDIPVPIMYEDATVMVINKPVGMVVHPGSGNPDGTLVNAIAFHLLQENPHLSEQELSRYGLVHRIDKMTSGLLVMAKSPSALNHLARQFFHHTVHRRYVALVWGDMELDEGTIAAHVGRHQRHRKLFTAYPDGEYGKAAITHYKVLERLHYVTIVECRLETGRTHQIRVHMQHLGHPLFNDDTYGGDKIVKGTVYPKYKQFVENCFKTCSRQALHAKELGFQHPVSGKQLHFESPLAPDMEAVIEKWRGYIAAYK